MSLRAEIETWVTALEAYDQRDFDNALVTFEQIAETSKIVFNIGIIYATLGEHDNAVQTFSVATKMDEYFAVAYFQRGVSNFLLGSYDEAIADFDNAYLYLRQNLTIDYEQLGLKFRLYSCEVLFNRGLALIYAGQEDQGLGDMSTAQAEKQTAEHSVIDEALGARGDGYTVFSIPVGVVYRPPANKVKNLQTKNYLGQAKLIAATDAAETFVGFTGSERQQQRASPAANVLPTSRGPAVDAIEFGRPSIGLPGAGGGGLARRGTAAARMEQTNSAPLPAGLQQRRPSENTAAISAGLSRSQTNPHMRSNPTFPPVRQMTRETSYNDDASRYGGGGGGRMASNQQDYDDIVDDYGFDEQDEAPAPLRQSSSNWGQNNNNNGMRNNNTLRRSNSSPMTPGNFGRSPSYKNRSPSGASGYDGYAGSEVYSEPAQVTQMQFMFHVGGHKRGMVVQLSTSHDEFVGQVRSRFSIQGEMVLKYKDDDGDVITIFDEYDWESAVRTATTHVKGKLEIWVEE